MMAASADRCSHCGKAGVGLQRCSRCKQASYCGAACQNANWKRHKKTCASVEEVLKNVNAANVAHDWRGVLKWEGRMEELMVHQPDASCESALKVLAFAHKLGWNSTSGEDHAVSYVELEERRIPLLAKLQLLRDQGELMCDVAGMLSALDQVAKAGTWYQRARDVGAAHGFFVLESKACGGLGRLAMREGRHEEGVGLLRNSLAAAQLNEMDDPTYEITPLADLVEALFTTDEIDEVESMIPRYRKATKAQSDKEGGVCVAELDSIVKTARVHEARGRPEEAAGEVRALLDLMRQNAAKVQAQAVVFAALLQMARIDLTVLDWAVGDKELIQAVAVELYKVLR